MPSIAHRISELSRILSDGENSSQTSDLNHENCSRHLHPIKKWPMRSRLYANGLSSTTLIPQQAKEIENEEEIASNDAAYSCNFLNAEEWETIDFSNCDLFNSFNFSSSSSSSPPSCSSLQLISCASPFGGSPRNSGVRSIIGGLLPMNGWRPVKTGLRPLPNIGGLRFTPVLSNMNRAAASKSHEFAK
ncbi:hypothetical protein B4U79_15853 [Dinothrombium tinctorium]|uniref:Uncharacterized protein n=1 Tax=Dinothrombium tinctorium TaxID=1965070 RepID=A0A443RNL8_9ACAR|nr:hypothetical protein B4U79_15853 [Dinothrombium tinctorium]